MADESFAVELWEGDLRDWFLHFMRDLIKTASIVATLFLFWEVIALLRFAGYPQDLCQALEKTHFYFMWSALAAISLSFVLKQVFSVWPKRQ